MAWYSAILKAFRGSARGKSKGPTGGEGVVNNASIPDGRGGTIITPDSRVTVPDHRYNSMFGNFDKEGNSTVLVDPMYTLKYIPMIKRLVEINPDFGQVLYNLQTLANTGHRVNFGPKTKESEVEKMLSHLETRRKDWAPGCADIGGWLNRVVTQLVISGATAFESVISPDLRGIKQLLLISPENIRFSYNYITSDYEPYQLINNIDLLGRGYADKYLVDGNLIKLNPNTFKYYAINGDGEAPYGYPPLLNGIEPIIRQKKMMDNIDYLLEQMGLMGFLQVLVDKPDINSGESMEAYTARLKSFLNQVTHKVEEGYKKGTVVSYKQDYTFEFHSAAKTAAGVTELFRENEMQVFSGLKMDPSLMGRGYASSQTQLTITFTKLLSEIKNFQEILKRILEQIYSLELLLAGFSYDYIKVEFNSSTVSDELKAQQVEEYKVRSTRILYQDGIISQEEYARRMGYPSPDLPAPRYDPTGASDPTDPDDSKKEGDREKDKDASDRKTREKGNPQPKKLGV